jgi:hypothetical protein
MATKRVLDYLKLNKNRKTKKFKKLTAPVLPKLSKKQLTKILYPITLDQAIDSFNQLRAIDCNNISTLEKTGTDFVNYFTAIERLNTAGRLKISFFDVYYNFNELYNAKYYFRNGITSVYKGKFLKSSDDKKIKSLKSFFTLYLGNIGVFRPSIVKDIICKYKPKVMLDFTMGWGGRLVGACCENIDKYIGIDLNTNLKPLYADMVKTLNKLSTTKIQLFFKSALDVDYSKLDYDFVLTSPPYYNVEVYNKSSVITEKEWNDTFYIPVFTNTYKHLKSGGYYCLNIPIYIYDSVCVPILGKCYEKIPLGRRARRKQDGYHEYIYIWKK